ncbi:hypothetical protein IC229_12405 [Spirosoma sp. BT702]|uniref:Uncharacterized protein n=1 Tax=Spirosoma profusum TaxID=2771354 RepID=A0A927ANA4_9BACT|nr:hypothetical protein [Spirosoma profusum]MBD2701444.1 hypothetical protein [Spirosoma profusum]
MKPNQAETFLSARIKLLKRHLLEWKTLLINQRTVRVFAHENIDTLPSLYCNAIKASADLSIRQASRLGGLLMSQQEELGQMKARHQQEDTDLEQIIKISEENSN